MEMDLAILKHIALGFFGVALIFFVKIVKFNAQLTFAGIYERYSRTIGLSFIGVVLFTVAITVVPDITVLLQYIGINLQLPTGELNSASFVMLGVTLFYFVNDAQGSKEPTVKA